MPTLRLKSFLLACLLLATAFAATAGATENPTADVIGGTSVSQATYDSTFPYTVGLMFDGDPLNAYCGGTLIAAKWVLTAAHCKDATSNLIPKNIVIGRATLNDTSHGEIVPVSASYQHPFWDPSNVRNDMMLLKLGHAVASPFPIALATAADDPAPGLLATLAGWGITVQGPNPPAPPATLRQTTVDVVSNANCDSLWGGVGFISDTMLCAIHQTPPVRMACNGDSGGPLTYNNHIVGIVSFGIENCMSNAPNAYTRVSKYSGMIYGLMQKFLAPNQQSLTFPFTNVDDGSTSSQTVTMKSEGDNPVIVQSITADGDFFVANNACNGTIAPGTSCDVTVAFDPTANGTRTGSLHVVTDSPGLNDFPVALTGTGVGHLGPKAKLRVSLRGKTKKQHGRLRAAFNVSFPLPKGSTPKACIGAIRISVKTPHVKKPTARSGAIIWTGKSCRGTVIMRLPKKAKGKKVKIKESFAGNVEIAPSSVTHTVKIK